MSVDKLSTFRKDIDLIDTAIVDLLAQRFAIAAKVAAYKSTQGIEVRLNDRIAEVLNTVGNLAKNKGADADAIRAIYETIIETTCRFEEAKMAKRA